LAGGGGGTATDVPDWRSILNGPPRVVGAASTLGVESMIKATHKVAQSCGSISKTVLLTVLRFLSTGGRLKRVLDDQALSKSGACHRVWVY
jgi:hypothetical protein